MHAVKFAAAAAFVALLLSAGSANATLSLQLERIDDSTVVLTGTGTTDFAGMVLGFAGASSTGNDGFDSHAGDFAIGGLSPFEGFIRADEEYLLLAFDGGGFGAGAGVSGSLTITLDVETWSPVGTTGTVFLAENSPPFFGLLSPSGTYEIVAASSPVPEPATLVLLGLGLAGLGGMLRRRKV